MARRLVQMCWLLTVTLALVARPQVAARRPAGARQTRLEAGGSLLTAYHVAMEQHYLLTCGIQSFSLMAVGDVVAQTVEMRASRESASDPVRCVDSKCYLVEESDHCPVAYDPVRTLRLACLGGLINGLGASTWLRALEHALPGGAHPTMGVVSEKAALDACLWAPVSNAGYLLLAPLLEGKPLEDAAPVAKDKFASVMRVEWLTFLPYNLIAFSVIPPMARPVGTGLMAMGFGVYMSFVTHAGARRPPASPARPADAGPAARNDADPPAETGAPEGPR